VLFIKRLFADIKRESVEHIFVTVAYPRNEPVQGREPRLWSVHGIKIRSSVLMSEQIVDNLGYQQSEGLNNTSHASVLS